MKEAVCLEQQFVTIAKDQLACNGLLQTITTIIIYISRGMTQHENNTHTHTERERERERFMME